MKNNSNLALQVGALLAVAGLLGGCQSASSTARRPTPASGPMLVYEPASERATGQRSAELQRNGYTQAEADRKTLQETSAQSWRVEDPHAWARERERESRSTAREKMEKDLAKLDAK